MTSKHCQRRVAFFLVVAAFVASSAFAPDDGLAWAAEKGPADGCVVTVAAPADARLEVDGRNYGAKRTITFRPLAPGRAYCPHFVVHFADGGRADRFVPLVRGRQIDLPVRQPSCIVLALSRLKETSLSELMRMNADGSGRKWITRGKSDAGPCISPDGQWVAFSRSETVKKGEESATVTAICIIPSAGGEAVRVCEGVWPLWSPDGSQIAFQRYSRRSAEGTEYYDLFVVSRDGGPVRELGEVSSAIGSGPAHRRAAWSPDGTKIAVIRGEGFPPFFIPSDSESKRHVYIVDVGTGQARQLTDHRDWAFDAVAWSPDGAKLGCQLTMRDDPSSQPSRKLANCVGWLDPENGRLQVLGDGYTPVCWSPDGRLLAFCANASGDVGVISVEKGATTAFHPKAIMSEEVEITPFPIAFSPDGSALLIQRDTMYFDDQSDEETALDLYLVPVDRPRSPRAVLHWQGMVVGIDCR